MSGDLCQDSCAYARNNVCDDGGPNSAYADCAYGTDCADCGPRTPGGASSSASHPSSNGASTSSSAVNSSSSGTLNTLCLDTCPYYADGMCDDGGTGSEHADCDLGTDCTDCGPRLGSSPGSSSTSGPLVGGGPHFPHWPIPDPNTTFCADGFQSIACPQAGNETYGQDGNYALRIPEYTSTTNTVTDTVTGLMWQRVVPNDMRNWEDARLYCSVLNMAGYTDWSLPSRVALITLIKLTGTSPTIDADAFPGTKGDAVFWSSSRHAAVSGHVNFLSFATGMPGHGTPDQMGYVRCVRSTVSVDPYGQYDLAEDSVRDTRTLLTWQRNSPGQAYAWSDALAFCEELTLGGQLDWRLPNFSELMSIVDDSRTDPAIDPVAFPRTVETPFWSSTPKAPAGDTVYTVDFTDGTMREYYADDTARVRCVR